MSSKLFLLFLSLLLLGCGVKGAPTFPVETTLPSIEGSYYPQPKVVKKDVLKEETEQEDEKEDAIEKASQ